MHLASLFRAAYERGNALWLVAAILAVSIPGAARVGPYHGFVRGQAVQADLPQQQLIPPHDYDVRHIKLDLRFDWEREQALGAATITFAPLISNMRTLDLDSANMSVSTIQLSSGVNLPFVLDTKNEKLRITLDRPYQPTDELIVRIAYTTNGTLSGTGILGFGQGLTFIKPTANDPQRPRQIWSQGESEYNHTWFPCWDHPNDLATSEMVATVDRPYTVISNGRLLETRDNPDNTRTFHWRMEQPHASYLTSIIVGEYTPVEMNYDGVPVIAYVYPNEAGEGSTTFARTPDMVRFFSERTGVRYPYAKYSQTTVRDFGGGMENISATTLTDTVIHDRRTALDRDEDGLISHELAHQWFGDYVTCRTWADIWLNESFATYFQAMWTEKSKGRDEFLYSDVKGNQDQYFAAWERGQRRPVVTANYRNADDLFDTYAYPRGGAVLHMLRVALGEENWWRSIRYYLKRYAHQPVETAQLRIAIEEATGQPMDWFFQQWIYQMGHPVLRVSKNYDDATKTLRLAVRQEQKLDPNSAYPQARYFRLPVDVEIETAGQKRIERITVEPQAEQTFTLKADSQPLLVNFDYGGTLIKELNFEKPTGELVYQITHDDDVLGRLRSLDALIARATDAKTGADERENIARTISGVLMTDKFWGVRVESARKLRGANYDFVKAAWLTASKDANARVRSESLAALATTGDASLAPTYKKFLADESYGVIRQAALALASTKDAGAYEQLARLVDTSSWRDQIRIAGLDALAALGDRRAAEFGARYGERGNASTLRAAAVAVLGSTGKDNPRAFQIISETLLQGAEISNFPLATAASEALVQLGDKRGLSVLQQAREKTRNESLRTALNAYEQRLQPPSAAAAHP